MRMHTRQPLLALTLLVIPVLGTGPVVLSSGLQPEQIGPPAASERTPVAATRGDARSTVRAGEAPPGATTSAPAELALQPCRSQEYRAACHAYQGVLADYGLDIDDLSPWSLLGLQRFLETVERLADAFGGGGSRAQRIARFTVAMRIGPDGTRIRVLWDAAPQQRDGNPLRGGYAANRLYFNPNTLFLDVDTPEEARGRCAEAVWWNFMHELAHLWDERSAPVAGERYSARMQRWLHEQRAAGRADEYPSSYAIIGGGLEAFAESVAATTTGDAANRDYYGSPRDHFVRAALCETVNCLR